MRDYLLDLVEHTFDLGCIDLIKIVGDDKTTQIVGMAQDQSVVVLGNYHNPVPEFIGTFGMPNLGKLKTLLNLQEYKEDAKLGIARRAADNAPEGINFENKAGDFKNSYRFMAEEIVKDKLKTPKFAGVNWHIQFEPSNASIQRLKWQMSANAEEANFQAKTDNGDLKFFFGDHSSHAGNFVFHAGVSGQLKRAWAWPAAQFASILSLTGDKVVKISDDGAAQITVNSGLAVYNYILPAQSK
jgi:hypothetical protein